MRSRLALTAVPLLLVLAGCAGSSSAPGGVYEPTPVQNQTTAAAARAAAVSKPTVKTAAVLITALAAKVSTVGKPFSYTASTDENHLLGRPGGYVSKAAFVDSRIHNGASDHDASLGGGVEVYTTAAAGKQRADYIASAEQAAGGLAGSEYDYVVGGAILRVSGDLTPAQAKNYKAVWPAVVHQVLGG